MSVEASMTIGGKAVDASDAVEERNPARLDEVVGRFPLGNGSHAAQAVAAAKEAFVEWSRTPVSERAARLKEAGDALETRVGEWQEFFTREHGKPLFEAGVDIQIAGALLDYYGSHPEFLDERVVADTRGTLRVTKAPVGVCAAIVPWNWPLALSALKIGPALLSGNTLVIKGPDFSTITMLAALGIVAEHFPPGVLNVVAGQGPEVGDALVRHPDVRKITLTGGTATGRIVAANAASQLKRVTLELGGNDAAIMLDDVELNADTADRIVLGAFMTTGQICFANTRLFVPRSRLSEAVDVLRAAIDRIVVGDGLDPDVTMGPLNNVKQYQSVVDLLSRTQADGLDVHELGTLKDVDPGNGYFVRPHLIIDPPDTADIVSCEQFGPLLPILAYDSIDEAVARANQTEFGLCSSIWTTDDERAFELATQLEAGTTFINGHSVFDVDFDAPFGGVKSSGYGRELGPEAVHEYVQMHSITNKRM
jgi:acyl-CoA reductase-like NAD-dependent aldehyde dehydrogenase